MCPPPCRNKGTRYVVTGCSFCLYLVLVLFLVVLVLVLVLAEPWCQCFDWWQGGATTPIDPSLYEWAGATRLLLPPPMGPKETLEGSANGACARCTGCDEDSLQRLHSLDGCLGDGTHQCGPKIVCQYGWTKWAALSVG